MVIGIRVSVILGMCEEAVHKVIKTEGYLSSSMFILARKEGCVSRTRLG